MNDRVSVGTSFADAGFIFSLVFGPVALLGGAYLLTVEKDQTLAVGAFGLGLMMLVVAFARWAYLLGGRKWLADTDRGFNLTAHGREHKFDDEDVLELAAKVSARFANGLPKANVRKGTLRIDSPAFPKPVDFRYEWPLDREDPLLDLFDRLLSRLTRQAEGELARDGELTGDGWALTRDGLELPAPDGDGPELLRFDRMVACEVVDGKVSVWASGEPRPVLSVALDTPNAPVLLQVLGKRLADKPPDDDDDPESLGRVIFERNTSHSKASMFVGGVFALLLFVAGCAVLYFFLTGRPNDRPPLGLAIGLHAGAAGLGAVIWFGRQNVLRCHARGVCRLKNGKATEMRYDEMTAFTYSATRHYHNGAYTGTILNMQFEAVDGRKVQYNTNVKNADDGLETLREHVGRVVAAAMKRRIDAGKVVRWTDRAEFEPDGIAIAGKNGLFGKQADAFIEWADVDDVRLDQGKFALFARGRNQPVFETTVATPNFFPGFYLILLTCFPPRGEEE